MVEVPNVCCDNNEIDLRELKRGKQSIALSSRESFYENTAIIDQLLQTLQRDITWEKGLGEIEQRDH